MKPLTRRRRSGMIARMNERGAWCRCAEASLACFAFSLLAWLIGDRRMVAWAAAVGVLSAIASMVLSDRGEG